MAFVEFEETLAYRRKNQAMLVDVVMSKIAILGTKSDYF
ncbi:uncharacterized protein G2W53_002430 [Senna tora]|uniref:Uncharacterized protein n=1 Tax=Senna tora TaxID=362788 RepID=A0A834XJ85_9FABA|nr:uncharacterized protein G2W53_002430 [Senna tora]